MIRANRANQFARITPLRCSPKPLLEASEIGVGLVGASFKANDRESPKKGRGGGKRIVGGGPKTFLGGGFSPNLRYGFHPPEFSTPLGRSLKFQSITVAFSHFQSLSVIFHHFQSLSIMIHVQSLSLTIVFGDNGLKCSKCYDRKAKRAFKTSKCCNR